MKATPLNIGKMLVPLRVSVDVRGHRLLVFRTNVLLALTWLCGKIAGDGFSSEVKR